jgi:hypothetical protein
MPTGVTPELMSDYSWMIDQFAQLKPLFTRGAANGYMCFTFGWVIAECVRRTDPKNRLLPGGIRTELPNELPVRSEKTAYIPRHWFFEAA